MGNSSKFSKIVLVGMLILLLISGVESATAAPSTAPALFVSPNNGLAGSVVNLSGSGYTGSLTAEIHWNGVLQTSFIMPGSGSFSISFTIPFGAGPGVHAIKVCIGCGLGEFEEAGFANFTVLAAPTNTLVVPTNTWTPRPTATITPTPTEAPCVSRMNVLSPERFPFIGGEAGFEVVDVVIEIFYNHDEPLSFTVKAEDWSEVFTQWPDPFPGTTVEVENDPGYPLRYVVTVRDVPLYFGRNSVKIEMLNLCPGLTLSRGWFYAEFYNGDTTRGEIRPAMCESLGLDPEATVLPFENFGDDYYFEMIALGEHGVSFENSVHRESFSDFDPYLFPRSGRSMAASVNGLEFWSTLQPIRMNFTRPLTALGMFVGLGDDYGTTGDINAILTVYGYAAGADTISILGTSSVSFPSEPTEEFYCITYEAEEGDLIARAVLEYRTGSFSAPERRIIDDLTLVYASEDVVSPEDLPPVVDLTSPSGTEMITSADLHIRAGILEDRELVKVSFRINDGDLVEIGFSADRTDPTRYITGYNMSALSLDPNVLNTITVVAEDRAGQIGQDSVVLTIATPVPDLDIVAQNVEIIQTIQCLEDVTFCGANNSIHLYTKKPTLVRLYVYAVGVEEDIENVSGRLCFGSGECVDSINLITVSPLGEDVEDSVEAYRGDLESTLNFLLPYSVIQNAGSYDMVVEVNPDMEDVNEYRMDNNSMLLTAQVRQSRDFNVVTVVVRSQDIEPADAGAARREIMTYFRSIFPSGQVQHPIMFSEIYLRRDYEFTDEADSGCGDGWGALLSDLRSISGTVDLPSAFGGDVYWYGMVDNAVPSAYGGCGRRPGHEAGGLVNHPIGGPIMAQEIGHNLGRQHPRGCSAENVDGSYPWESALANTWGIDLLGSSYPYTIYGRFNYDFMGYCGWTGDDSRGYRIEGIWVSAYTYKAIGRDLYGIAQVPGGSNGLAAINSFQSLPPYLIGTLNVNGSTVEEAGNFFVYDLSAEQYNRLVDTSLQDQYFVELLKEDGEFIEGRYFDLMELSNSDYKTDNGLLYITLPFYPDAAKLVVSRDDVVIFEKEVSSNAPIVELISPADGVVWPESGLQTIEWTASDADGDDLSYILQYSMDGGELWNTVTVGLEETSFEVDAAGFAGSNQAVFRVIASDGFNTVSSQNQTPITVPQKAPQVNIDSPTEGAVFGAGNLVILNGNAIDYEDGILSDDAFVWSSDIDGRLGQGPILWGMPISAGEHTITLEVTDRDGMTASKSVFIEVLDVVQLAPGDVIEQPVLDEDAGGESDSSSGSTIWIIGIVGLVIGLFFWLTQRKQQVEK